MAIYAGQIGIVNNAPFVRVGDLIAIGRNGDFESTDTTLATKDDLIPPLEIHGSRTTDSGRLVADRQYKALAILGDPDSMLARIETGKLLQRLHPDYRMHLDFGEIMNPPEIKGTRHAERR